MPLLHIYDSSDWTIRLTAKARGVADRLPIFSSTDLVPALDRLLAAGRTFDRILFETHGGTGIIGFDDPTDIDAAWWSRIKNRYNRLTTTDARVYFNGCNVAEGEEGWRFLEAAAGVFLTKGGGQIFGQNSSGFANPFNGHTVHFWGSTRSVFVDVKTLNLSRYES